MPRKLNDETQELLADMDAPDKTIENPPGEPAMVSIRPLTRDDGNIAQIPASVQKSVKRMNIVQHEFSPLVRKVDDDGWRSMASEDGGVNWRIIQQYDVEA